jgi:polyadenylate-binding protein
VSFEKAEDAECAVNEMNGYEIPDSELKLTVCRAQKKAEREAELSRVYEQLKVERLQRYQGVNLYVKNLDDSVDSEELRRNFEQHGEIASAKVMLDDSGRSKGFGFVCFHKPDDATKAVVEMNNRMLAGKPLYVALAQRKEDRKAQLASQYMQRMASMRMQSAGGGMPVYAPNAGFYVQNAIQNQRGGPFVSNALPAQMRSGNVAGWNGLRNTGYGAMQGYMVPQNQYGAPRGAARQQAGTRPQHYQTGNRAQNRPGVAPVAGQPAIRQQQIPQQGKPIQQGQANYYQQLAQQGRQGIPQQHGQGGPVQQEDLSSKLSAAAPQEQKQILGEKLYPLISQLCKEDQVGKITGMMLEMENSELLVMLENPNLLQERVNEAASVLQQSSKPANS